MSTGTGGGSEGMNNGEGRGLDRKQLVIIALGVVVAILVGLIVGFVLFGGLSDDPVAAPATTATTPSAGTVPGTTPPTTVPPSTLIPGQLSIPATEDTYLNSFEPEVINGLEDILEIENDPPEIKHGLIRFEVSGIPEGETIELATLRLYVVKDTEAVVPLHSVDGDWTQADTTWATAPTVGASVGTIPPNVPEGSYAEVDVTEVVQGPGQYDFYLVPVEDDSVEFATIESGTNPPLLIVDWGSGGGDAASGAITELSGDPIVLAGAGDIADCDLEGDSVTAELLDQVVEEDGETIVFTTGDNVYPSGSAEDFAACYDPTWGQHKERTRPAPGNHEYDTEGASGYFGYFGDAAGDPGEGYYSYQAGEWHVIVLNSNCEDIGGCQPGSSQEEWLREELAESEAACILAYWHHPLVSSAGEGGTPEVLPLFQALHEAGADVVVTGHDHNYERFARQDPDGTHDPVGGIRQFVVGTGGKGGPNFGEIAPNSESRFSATFGILKLSLYTDGYEWEFLTGGSGFNDVGIEACH